MALGEKNIFREKKLSWLKNWTFSRELNFDFGTKSNISQFQTFENLPKKCEIAELCFKKVSYFGHGQCFIWEFPALAFIETARLNITSFRILSWSGNDTVLVCKLSMWTPWIKTLILDNIYIDSLLLVAFAKYILSQIYSHFIQNGTFQYFWRLWKLLFFEKNIIEILLYFYLFIQKAITSTTEKYLVVESCPTPQWITFLMFYRLLYNILSYLNNMISAWSALLQ